MIKHSFLRLFIFINLLAAFYAIPVFAQSPSEAIRISVDLREAPRHIYHAKLIFPAQAGPLTLVYPQWIQGEHAPVGPIMDLTGLKMSAGGKEISWRRDDVDMYAFHLEVPAGGAPLEVHLDYVSPAEANGSREHPTTTARLAVLNWFVVALYPQGRKTDDLTYTASLRLPAGWKYGTALPLAKESAEEIHFAPASLTTLIDSPVITGANFRSIDLAPGQKPEHVIHIAADGPGALAASPSEVQHLRQLVAETGALFGARHYRRYDFLLSLSDKFTPDGVEHHESSDNKTPEDLFLDPDVREVHMDLLAHEFTHSWNGKYRRPVGLATTDYQSPLRGDLLWVYEGLTQYYGVMLAARSGFWTPEKLREYLATVAADLDNRSGRSWRDLQDTALAAQILYSSPEEWSSWRRGVDYYDESLLIWLEADTIIRRESKGKKSLDDFCHKFHGGESASGAPKLSTYTFDDVVAAMNQTAPYDWRNFFTQRLLSHGPGAPLGGLENSGWKLVFNDTINDHQRSGEVVAQVLDAEFSLGFSVHAANGEEADRIEDVIPGSPAANAGLAPGMLLLAVNGRKWTPELLREAIRQTKNSKQPLELLAENDDYFQTYRLEYHGSDRYPHLEAIAGKSDVLSEITRMRAAPVALPADY